MFRVLEITQKWFNSNITLLNYNKTNFMQFSSNICYRTLDAICVEYTINIIISIENIVP
jgi:hypothetical protein